MKLTSLAFSVFMAAFLFFQTACGTQASTESAPKIDEKEQIAANKKAFAELLEKNKLDSTIKEIMPGLQYQIMKQGTGKIPTEANMVQVHYTGSLIDGTIFDSSIKRGEPAVFGVSQVIKGWQEVLKKMPVGSEWRVYISSDLAYGDQGSGTIPGGAGLVFIIKLLSIQS